MKQKYLINITDQFLLPSFLLGLLRDIDMEKKFSNLNTKEIFKFLKRNVLLNQVYLTKIQVLFVISQGQNLIHGHWL